MADESFTVLTVECLHCKTKQTVHVAFWRGSTPLDGGQTLRCLKCGMAFDVAISDQIVGGPFPA
jgi:hypothetical protein